jgi:hypothetical protein
VRQGIAIGSLVVLVGLPAGEAAGQWFAGGAAGAGGADVPVGNFASGLRGALRLFAGYELHPNAAVEVMTLDLGTPDDKPAGSRGSRIGAIGLGAVGALRLDRWRLNARAALMSIKGKADGAETEKSTQPMVGLGVGYDVASNWTVGLEGGATRVRFAASAGGEVDVKWLALAASYRF